MVERIDYQHVIHQNRILRNRLEQSELLIAQLREEIVNLKASLSKYQCVDNKQQGSSEQIFTDSDGEDSEQIWQSNLYKSKENIYRQGDILEIPLLKQKTYNEQIFLQQSIVIDETQNSDKGSTFNYSQYSISKPKSLQRNILMSPKTQCKTSKIINQSIKQLNGYSNVVSSTNLQQKNELESLLEISNQERKTTINKSNSLFTKFRTNKPIYKTFFVTGLSQQLTPSVIYHYPKQSGHFQAILNLVYNESPLIKTEVNKNIAENQFVCYKIKDTFIIPIKKENSEGRETQYLVCCEVEDVILHKKQTYCVTRLFCFITECKFFKVFQKILTQILERIHNRRVKLLNNLTQSEFRILLQEQIQEPLKRLNEQTVEFNQYLTLCLSEEIKIVIDTPPFDHAYKMVLEYKPWQILNNKIEVRNSQTGVSTSVMLRGLLTIYLATQTKIVLFSSVKSKLSEAILHSLQLLLPLQFVNPIIMANLREIHQEYIDAPIPLLIGLWNDGKKAKQKIQIFMNKRLTLLGMLEKNKLPLNDGIVINLDTNTAYGGAIQDYLCNLAIDLNYIFENESSSLKDQYRLFSRMLDGRQNLKPQVSKFWQMLHERVKKTQLYCYYMQQIDAEYGKCSKDSY